ncbi:hypothetical protein SPV1_01582 [Mariprofundus ferrooxydans PV-1]|uniref:Uncharacterized protein n=1 Tax=Mariprofundus ferrooxydans PV-1 TaxID=314345 RepID=Q0F2F2_9PROT|nr:hypothetical protein SPV1_01582 [Mariprofundus ferrooxydans PV-1]
MSCDVGQGVEPNDLTVYGLKGRSRDSAKRPI